MTHTAKLATHRGEYAVLIQLDGKTVERTWSFKKKIARERLAELVKKYSIPAELVTIDSAYLR